MTTDAMQHGADLIAAWDAGRPVFTVEMGGLGPSYEQVLQVAMIEIVRASIGQPLPGPDSPEFDGWGRAALQGLDLGLSGAQAGAAQFLAYRILRDGHEATIASMEKHDPGRVIQVSRAWPTGGTTE